jgi:cellulose biosynthesis protein BcsQ
MLLYLEKNYFLCNLLILSARAKDRTWEMEALCKLLSLKNSLLEKLRFDYVIFDSSPGLDHSSINAVVSADGVLVVTTLDKSDLEGTRQMIKDLNELFEKKTRVILNKVPFDFLPLENLERRLESLQLPIAEAIPCSCDIAEAEGKTSQPTLIITQDVHRHLFFLVI